MEGDDAGAPPRDVVAAVMKEGVKALMALPSGTVVCFVDANGPLATVREGGNAKAPRWVLRPYVDLTAARAAGACRALRLRRCVCDAGSQRSSRFLCCAHSASTCRSGVGAAARAAGGQLVHHPPRRRPRHLPLAGVRPATRRARASWAHMS
jgi:hypothetical protein